MNQILVTKKLYITPELKRKKKLYKLEFLLSLFIVVVLISVCIYAEYDRNKSEEVSQEILEEINQQVDTTIANSNVLVVILNELNESTNEETPQEKPAAISTTNKKTVQKTQDGFKYTTVATVSIPKIDITYPVIDGQTDSVEETEALLKMSPTKFWGPEPNEVGNFCIVGHNYRDTRFFSKVPTLENGDIIELTDISGKTKQYKVYSKYQVEPSDVSCTSQLTNGKREITLITCTDDNKYRVIVKAVEV